MKKNQFLKLALSGLLSIEHHTHYKLYTKLARKLEFQHSTNAFKMNKPKKFHNTVEQNTFKFNNIRK